MAVLNIYNLAGEQTGTVEVNDAVFGIEPNKVVLHEEQWLEVEEENLSNKKVLVEQDKVQ